MNSAAGAGSAAAWLGCITPGVIKVSWFCILRLNIPTVSGWVIPESELNVIG